ncbi:multidrug transporter [Streptomyces sp. XY431]|uniref:DMT family transporter n=1 Tax=Streptomyces sp. XY431 TaxID=1415562 RepID=UPI0006B00AD3|nr:DMT family transporter [Streptomyces sp. XY431]KOV34095.1 multidrug transporter [Streptomyces sp. XY431]
MAVLALLWGSGFLWTKLALQNGLTPLQITVARSALGAAVLLLLARAARQRLPRGGAIWRRLAVAAFFCNALPFFLAALGVRTVGSGPAGVLNATTPLWSLLIGFALGTERGWRPRRLGGLLLGFAGVLVIFSPWQGGGSSPESGGFGWGALALLGAAASYAVAFTYMGRVLADTGTAPLALSAAQLTVAAGLGALALPAAAGSTDGLNVRALAAVTVLGVVSTGLTFHLNYRLIATEGATGAATVGYLLPVVSTGLGALVLDEALSLRAVAGMIMVLAGVLLTRPQRPRQRSATPAVPAPSARPPFAPPTERTDR